MSDLVNAWTGEPAKAGDRDAITPSQYQFWSDVYDVLVEECGANNSPDSSFGRVPFIGHQSRGNIEFRFMGALGYGGKLYFTSSLLRPLWVGCYAEDASPERKAMIERANTRLAQLALDPRFLPREAIARRLPRSGYEVAAQPKRSRHARRRN